MPNIAPTHQRRISDATHHIASAERELEVALSEVEVSERADKKLISKVLQSAFERLSAAKKALDEVLREDSGSSS